MINCNTCGRHIRLERAGFEEEERTEALMGDDLIEPLPPMSGSVSDSFRRPNSRPNIPASPRRPVSKPTAMGLPDPAVGRRGPIKIEHAAAADLNPQSNQAMDAPWRYTDLPLAIKAVFDGRRFAITTLWCWLIIATFAALQALSAWLRTEVAALGTIFSAGSWIILAVGMCLLAATIAYISQARIIEARDCPAHLGRDWVKAWLHSILGTPLMVVGLIGGVVVLESLLGFIGRIPHFGPIFWGLTSPISALTNLVACGLIIALVYGITLYIPVIYHTRSGPRETIGHIKGMMARAPTRLLALLLGSQLMIVSFMMVTVLPVWSLAVKLGYRITQTTLGIDQVALFNAAPDTLKGLLALIFGHVHAIGSEVPTGTVYEFAGTLAGLGASIIPAIVVSIWLISTQTAGCIIYAIMEKRRR